MFAAGLVSKLPLFASRRRLAAPPRLKWELRWGPALGNERPLPKPCRLQKPAKRYFRLLDCEAWLVTVTAWFNLRPLGTPC